MAAACAEYGIPVIAYSPLGRGLLTGQIKSLDDIPANSLLRHFPRFQPDTFPINLELARQVETIAQKKGCTPSQLAIGWTRAMAEKAGTPIIPIPGATTADRVNENGVVIDLTEQDVSDLDQILSKFEGAGARYPPFIPFNT